MGFKVEVVGNDGITKKVSSCISLLEIGVSFFDITKSIFINRGGGREFMKRIYQWHCSVGSYGLR